MAALGVLLLLVPTVVVGAAEAAACADDNAETDADVLDDAVMSALALLTLSAVCPVLRLSVSIGVGFPGDTLASLPSLPFPAETSGGVGFSTCIASTAGRSAEADGASLPGLSILLPNRCRDGRRSRKSPARLRGVVQRYSNQAINEPF